MTIVDESNLNGSTSGASPRAEAGPVVSIIIPTYNRAGYLPATLDCLRQQTLQDFELIVVDDGSSDGTRELLHRRPESIRYIYQDNAGPAAARNRGLREARGMFVAFLDSDDLWQPRFLEVMSGFLRSHSEAGVAFCRFHTMSDDGRVLPRRGKTPHSGWITQKLFTSTFITTPSVLARREVILAAGGFNASMATSEDYDLWLRLSLKHQFGLVDEVLCLRRSHPGTQSRTGSATPLLRKAQMLERFYRQHGEAAGIPRQIAFARLAKVFRGAGTACCRTGRHTEAGLLLRRSLFYRPLAPTVWFRCLRADLLATRAFNLLKPAT